MFFLGPDARDAILVLLLALALALGAVVGQLPWRYPSTAMPCLKIGKNRNTLELELELELVAVGPFCSLRPVAYPQPKLRPDLILHFYL